jgi:hypothetical protein
VARTIPETNILYVNSQKSVSQLGLVPPRDPSKNDLAYVMGNALTGARTTGGTGSAAGGDRAVAPGTTAAAAAAAPAGEGGGGASITVQGLPIMKPPYGQLTAIDLGKGEILWQVPHGETPEAIKNHPLLKGLNIPRTGRPWRGRIDDDEDAGCFRRGRIRSDHHWRARRDAAGVRQGDGQGSRRLVSFPHHKRARR